MLCYVMLCYVMLCYTYVINENLSFVDLTNVVSHRDPENLGKALVPYVGWSATDSFLYSCFQFPIDFASSYFTVVHLLHSEFVISCFSRIQVLNSTFKLFWFLSDESQLEKKSLLSMQGITEGHCATARCHEQLFLVKILQ